MRKKTALTLSVLFLLSFLFFVSPVGTYVLGIDSWFRPAPSPIPATTTLPFTLPEGFIAHVFAEDVPGARVLARDPAGVLIASLTDKGAVVALPDRDGDGRTDETIVLLENLKKPHGLAVRCTERCELYVAEEDSISVYNYRVDETRINRPVDGKKIIELPKNGGHFTRSILFLPAPNDHKMLVSVGSSCNVCMEKDERRATVLIANADGSELREYATGLRNAVFLTTHYVTGDIWATEMGRDYLGDDLPPDEVNIIREGANYGWPFCYGKSVRDSTFRSDEEFDCATTEPSRLDIPAHSAPLGIAFVPEEGWPEEMWYDALVAYHGSWNRSTPTGYKTVRFPLDAEGNPEGEPQDFMTGFMDENGSVVGRPVDILLEPGGVMYVSDDKAGVIYRVVRTSFE